MEGVVVVDSIRRQFAIVFLGGTRCCGCFSGEARVTLRSWRLIGGPTSSSPLTSNFHHLPHLHRTKVDNIRIISTLPVIPSPQLSALVDTR